jgi:G6PDH family F420-dependent oxidoreductase
MTEIGYALSSEEFGPNRLVALAQRAEDCGFGYALVSDHFHPWTDRQGESPFVWSVIGGISQATTSLELGTGVTCPTMRIHPVVIAQAAATAAAMLPGRFFLGVGTGENLNEHVTGARWPAADIRLSMLEEAIALIRELWSGDLVNFHGDHYDVEGARIYTLPEEPPPIIIAAGAPLAADLAGRCGDGLCSTAPDREIVERYEAAGGTGPRYGQLTVCVAESVDAAKRTALDRWPNAAIRGELGQELPLPRHFEQAAGMVDEDDIGEAVVCGADATLHRAKIEEYADAGFDHVYLHQVGPDQDAFFDLYRDAILSARV